MFEEWRADRLPASNSAAAVVIRQEITIANELGLRGRPAAEFVHTARAFRSQIWLLKGEERFSTASIIELLIANLYRGDTATIEAEGPDAEEAVRRLAELTREFGRRDRDGTWDRSRRGEEDF